MSRTHFCSPVCSLLGIAVFASAAALASSAHAQAYPSRTIEWISHSSAGSGTDLFNRNVSDMLAREKIFAVPFIHSNRVGGNGVVAYLLHESEGASSARRRFETR